MTDWCDANARKTISLDTSQLTATPSRIRLTANVNLGSPLFTFFNQSGTFNVQVQHEEPFIGE